MLDIASKKIEWGKKSRVGESFKSARLKEKLFVKDLSSLQ